MEQLSHNNYPNRICITAVGTATSVGVIRNFRKYSPDTVIIGTDINPYGYTSGSMLVDSFYRVPLASDSDYIESLVDILTTDNVDFLIPINDTEIRTIAAHRDIIESTVWLLLPSLDTIDLVQDKQRMSDLARSIGIRVPETLNSDYSGRTIIRDTHGVGSKGIQIRDSLDVRELDQDRQFAQRFIDGDEYTVDILSDRSGNPIFIIPRLRIEVKSGVATKVKLINDQSLIDDCAALLRKVTIPGFSNIQFIRDSSGDDYFIEINPRIGGFSNSSLMAAPGMFPTYLELIGPAGPNSSIDSVEIKRVLNEGVRWGAVVTRYYTDMIYEE